MTNMPGRNDPCFCGSGKKYKQCCFPAVMPEEPQPVSLDLLLRQGQIHHQAGHFKDAADSYRAILARNPDHPDALHYLGVVASQTGQPELALRLMQRSSELQPHNVGYLCNLALVLQNRGQLSESIQTYQRAIAIDPQATAPLLGLGAASSRAGQTPEAMASLQRALVLQPDLPEAHFDLGNLLQSQDRLDEAIASYRQAVRCRPGYADALNNLGTILRSQGSLEEAIQCYREAVQARPNRPDPYFNLAIALQERRHCEDAAQACRAGLLVAPDSPELHFNLGNALYVLGDLDGAEAAFRRAIALRPGYAEAYGNLGTTLQEQGRMPQAAAAYEKAIALKPDYASAFSNLIYLHAFAWDIPPEEQLRIASKWECAALTPEQRAEARERQFPLVPRHHRRLRLGIVSAELGDHAVAEFLQPVLERLDRARFHLTLYPTIQRSGPRAEQFKALADQYTSLVPLADGQAAAQIRADQIDILLDTSGHTDRGRLGIFARRCAPVQCSWIGFWASTGLTEMDYVLAGSTLPQAFDAHFRETVWRLPFPANIYRGDPTLPPSQWRPADDGTVWLGSFNKYSKIREASIALWAHCLHRLPEAKLLFEDRTPFDLQLHPRIIVEFARQGIACDRLEFSPHNPGWRNHMQLYDRLDIAIDTLPFNSGTTAYDALWMGVPFVTKEGDWGGGQMGSLVLHAIGRPEWIARSPEEFTSIVTSLARDREHRREIRATQRARMASSLLCDAEPFARGLEDAFDAMFDRWAARQQE
ncbi:tetratricopeptide repeat protein [Acidobacteria bacterium AB60]|nr:tetratricopeptide repeat protein [Acidobacteria bacterium AB60]